MRLATALIGPFRSINSQQTLKVDPQVTVLVGMNEAGKTVLLKALQKANDALAEDKFDPIEDYPRKDLSSYLKTHSTTPASAAVLKFELDQTKVDAINKKIGTSLKAGHGLELIQKFDNSRVVDLEVDRAAFALHLRKSFSTEDRKSVV